MSQQLIILMFLIWAGNYFLHSVMFKKIANLEAKIKRQYWMYFFCSLLSLSFYFFTEAKIFTITLASITIVGIFNSVALYCNWQATDISQSKVSIFAQLDDVIAIGLGYHILKEGQFLNAFIICGIILCFSAAGILVWLDYKHIKKEMRNKEIKDIELKSLKGLYLLGWIVIYSIIWGILDFLIRYYALQGVSFSQFLIGWYGGSYIGSSILLLLGRKREKNIKLTMNSFSHIFIVALFTWINIIICYTIFKTTPLIVAQPIFMTGSTIIPLLVGLFIYKEIKELTKKGKWALFLGLIGSLIIMVGFIFNPG